MIIHDETYNMYFNGVFRNYQIIAFSMASIFVVLIIIIIKKTWIPMNWMLLK